jgi:hypothetical protein
LNKNSNKHENKNMATAPDYGKIDNATVQTKYPFHNEVGTHIVVIENWIGRDTRQQGFSDFCDWTIVKTLRGDDRSVGAKRSRMRIWSRDGTDSELKNRAQAALSAAMQKAKPGQEFPVAAVTGQVLKNIHEQAGRNVAGYPVKIEVEQVKTKTAKDFTAINYSVPTPRDLEGLELDDQGRVIL